jgi:dTDP-4-amino-4,6-dideoxygalactose transaminase
MNRQIKPEILKAFEDFFESNWYVLGDSVKDFEINYALFNETKYAVGVSNGLDALHLALKTLNIGEGDEVIVPSNTYIATLLAVTCVGAKPILVEPDLFSYNISPENIKDSISEKTKAIIPVHLYGQACDMDSIMSIAYDFNLKVIEDNAQAHGAKWNGNLTGSWGHINATSFYPGKNLGAYGDAGAITTNDEYLYKMALILRNYGSEKKYFNEKIGFNMRLDECQASFLNVKLKYINEWTLNRQQIASWYDKNLNGIGDMILPFHSDNATHVYHLYVIRTKFRDLLKEFLEVNKIGTLIHYPIPPHLQNAYKSMGYRIGEYPIAEEIANTCLSLPMWPGMTIDDVSEIANLIRSFYNRA